MSGSIPQLTIVALAWNEARHLGPCFESARPLVDAARASTMVLLDAAADEATRRAARHVAGRVVESRFVNFSKQRNRALDEVDGEWVFFIDPDERLTPALCDEIARRIAQPECNAWRVARRNIFFGREVRHTGWWPDYQTRLLRRAKCRYDESREVHEYPIVDGEICTLLTPMVHFNYESWEQFVRKQRSYAPLEARALLEEGHTARLRSLVGQPLREFARRYFAYQGRRDGWLGLALSLAMAAYRFDVYQRMVLMQRSRTR